MEDRKLKSLLAKSVEKKRENEEWQEYIKDEYIKEETAEEEQKRYYKKVLAGLFK